MQADCPFNVLTRNMYSRQIQTVLKLKESSKRGFSAAFRLLAACLDHDVSLSQVHLCQKEESDEECGDARVTSKVVVRSVWKGASDRQR